MVYVYLLLTLILAASYAALIVFILKYWNSIPSVSFEDQTSVHPFTIIIPARNESQNIESCLRSIIENGGFTKDLIQIIVVDDHSEDNTIQVIENMDESSIEIIPLSENLDKAKGEGINAYKKAAINLALQRAKYDYIIQLDADTEVSKNYLLSLSGFIQTNKPFFIAGPIMFQNPKTLFDIFQQLDIIGMMGVTAAGITSKKWYMANGANMVYRKQETIFEEDDIASGDDIYAIQQATLEDPEQIHFFKNKNVIVETSSPENLKAFYNQRIRWATKNKYMKGKSMQIMMAIPFLNSISILAHIPLFFFFGPIALSLLAFHLFIKMTSDFLLLYETTKFFNQEKLLKYFVPCNLMHLIYIASIGVLSLFVKKYNWKGRRVS